MSLSTCLWLKISRIPAPNPGRGSGPAVAKVFDCVTPGQVPGIPWGSRYSGTPLFRPRDWCKTERLWYRSHIVPVTGQVLWISDSKIQLGILFGRNQKCKSSNKKKKVVVLCVVIWKRWRAKMPMSWKTVYISSVSGFNWYFWIEFLLGSPFFLKSHNPRTKPSPNTEHRGSRDLHIPPAYTLFLTALNRFTTIPDSFSKSFQFCFGSLVLEESLDCKQVQKKIVRNNLKSL